MADLRRGVKWLLFLSSYIPLYPILAYKHRGITVTFPLPASLTGAANTPAIPVLSVFWIALIVVSAGFLALVFNLRRAKEPNFRDPSSPTPRNELITTYVLVYIFPFVILDYSEVVNWLAFIVFFLVIGLVQVRSNQLYVNPILAIFGYDIYEIKIDDRPCLLLSRRHPTQEVSDLKTVELSNDVHIAV